MTWSHTKLCLRESGCGSCFLGGLSGWEACLHVEPWSQAWNPRLSRVPMQAELVDTPPSICTSLGGGWVEKGPCLPCVCVLVPVTWVTTTRRRALLRARGQTRQVPAAPAPPTQRPTLPRESGSGEGRPPKADRCTRAHTSLLLLANPQRARPTNGPCTGGKFEPGEVLAPLMALASGFDYFRQANGLCWLFRLIGLQQISWCV